MFVGRESELADLNQMYWQDKFQLFVLYGRRRVGKTTLLNEFCKDKTAIFYLAEQSNNKLNLDKFSALVFQFYGETALEPFSSWENALQYIHQRQKEERLILIFDEFPYLVRKNKALLSTFQHMIDHTLQYGKLFLVLCGSYMGFMEKEILGAKSPIFGRRTGQLHMKAFDYRTSADFLGDFTEEEKLELYGAFGGTALYLRQVQEGKTLEENIKQAFLRVTAYLYEEPLLLLRQEVQETGIYSAIIETVARGATKTNEIATRIGEEQAKCIKYCSTLCQLGILYKETPFGEKESSRKTIYGISDLMFRFWYRYVFGNRTLLETGAGDIVWKRRIEPDYSDYMGAVFEKACREYLLRRNRQGALPILFSGIGRWWGTDPDTKRQVEIDLIAEDGEDYIFGECKWRREALGLPVLRELQQKADVFRKKRGRTWYYLFSKSGFTKAVLEAAQEDEAIVLVGLGELMHEDSVWPL
ncbi:MAG: ATP-binding protein [Lachnospiraceae bacterium]|nr:ATP-binding protein [Lachnospiraceae bacterium]